MATHRAALAAARGAGVESIHEWSAPLRECEDAVRATEEAYLTAEARNERGARVAPWATENEFVAARGAVAPPLPPPRRLAGYKTRGSELEDPFVGAMPELDSTRAWAKLPDREEDER